MRTARITSYIDNEETGGQYLHDEDDAIARYLAVVLTDGANHPGGEQYRLQIEELAVIRTTVINGAGDMQVQDDGERFIIVDDQGRFIGVDDASGGEPYFPSGGIWEAKKFLTRELAEKYLNACKRRAEREGWVIRTVRMAVM